MSRHRRTALLAAVPWLAELPAAVLDRLDYEELVVPRGAVAAAREQLEARLGARVATYRSPPPPPAPGRRPLCTVLPAATLDRAGVRALRAAEREFGVLFRAYARSAGGPNRA